MNIEKQLLVNEIKESFNASSSFIIARYTGMDPNLAASFRTSLMQSGGTFSVVKKRLFLKAAEELGFEIDRQSLTGHLGIIYAGDDTIATTKVLFKFKKEHDKKLDVLGGHFEGKMRSADEILEISNLPDKDEMRAQFLGVLEAPLSGIVSVMEAAMSGVISCIDQKVEKEESKQ